MHRVSPMARCMGLFALWRRIMECRMRLGTEGEIDLMRLRSGMIDDAEYERRTGMVQYAPGKYILRALLGTPGYELETRTFNGAHETRSPQGLASADATLDEAFNAIQGIDRNTLPAEVNQFIDLAAAASKVVSSDMADEGVPDPDDPNGSVYSN